MTPCFLPELFWARLVGEVLFQWRTERSVCLPKEQSILNYWRWLDICSNWGLICLINWLALTTSGWPKDWSARKRRDQMTNKVWLHPNKTASELTLKGQQWQRIWCALQLRVAKHACLNDGTRVCPHSTYSIRIWIYIYSGLENHWVYQFIIQNFWRFTWINQPPSHGGLYPSMICGALEALVTCLSVSLSSFVSWWFLVGRERIWGSSYRIWLQ